MITNYKVDISTKTILNILILVLALFFLYSIKEVLGVIFIAWVIASAFDPLVDKMQKYKIPRAISILVIYLILLFIVSLVFILFIPAFTQEVTKLTKDFPRYYDSIIGLVNAFKNTDAGYSLLNNSDRIIQNIDNAFTSITTGLYNLATGFVGGIVTFIIILVVTFYMTAQEEGIKNFIQSIVPANYQPYIIQKINRIQTKLGHWLWGQLVLMIIVGVLTAIALKIIGVPYILVLAIFAGLCEFIPIVGPVVACVPAVIFSSSDIMQSPIKPLAVIIAYILIQQLENHVLVPKIMNKAVGLNPIVVVIIMLIGAKIGGIIGIILAVPAATIISIFLEDFFTMKKAEANKLEGEEYINQQIKK